VPYGTWIDELHVVYPFAGSRMLRPARLRGREGRPSARRDADWRRWFVPPSADDATRRSRRRAQVYPYLLRKLAVTRPNQVWATGSEAERRRSRKDTSRTSRWPAASSISSPSSRFSQRQDHPSAVHLSNASLFRQTERPLAPLRLAEVHHRDTAAPGHGSTARIRTPTTYYGSTSPLHRLVTRKRFVVPCNPVEAGSVTRPLHIFG
jgi:hypothetical protein